MANNKLDLRNKISLWMEGRNGVDELARACVWVAIVLTIVAFISRLVLFNWLALALLVYAALRMSSRSIASRRRENQAFLSKIGPAGRWLRDPSAAAGEAREFKHIKCPECGQTLRVPRGKGKLRVRCPKCGNRFEAKS